MRTIILMLILLFCINTASADIVNLKQNGDFDLYPDSPIKKGTSWIGNDSTKWCVFYTSSPTQHSAQLVDGTLVVKTGSDGGINDMSIAGVPSSDPVLASWQTYGIQVKPSTTYTAFAFMNVNKTNANYLNIRQAKADGTNIASIISSRNSGTGYQFLEYQFTTAADTRYARVGIVTRNANTETIYYAVGIYEGSSGQLNQDPVIVPQSSGMFESRFVTLETNVYDIDNDVGIYNNNSLYVDDVYEYSTSEAQITRSVYLTPGLHDYYVSSLDAWQGLSVSDSKSIFVPDITYVDVVSDENYTDYIQMALYTAMFLFIAYVSINCKSHLLGMLLLGLCLVIDIFIIQHSDDLIDVIFLILFGALGLLSNNRWLQD